MCFRGQVINAYGQTAPTGVFNRQAGRIVTFLSKVGVHN